MDRATEGIQSCDSLSVPADGVKGKTWGPSTCHQRERCQIPMLRSNPRAGISSISAPNLIRPRRISRPAAHDIGNTADTTTKSSSGEKGDNKIFHLLKNTVNAFTHSEFKPFRNNAYRKSSYPAEEANALTRNRLSRSFGNISETHTYDTVYSNNSFLIARGVRMSNYRNASETRQSKGK